MRVLFTFQSITIKVFDLLSQSAREVFQEDLTVFLMPIVVPIPAR